MLCSLATVSIYNLKLWGCRDLFMCVCIMVYRVLTQPDRRATLILTNPHLACLRAEHLQGEQ